ncbi:hypothetical protein PHYPSEUDO_015543 [Phytophthora pseudosyringae]|uniref:WW domain-containing protein n=1 Tax=Phytophthora pseudosyringae TaxID=221518 RepID=A0A8T1W344_9STRA|nr:hypothetical protein PHYPSEUDO_015543 [Phytophthora pseudosyringae]
MALPPRGQWDVTYLASKYPWLRVDRQALEEFRSPFRWASGASPRSPARSSDGGSDERGRACEQQLRKGKLQARNREEESRPGRVGRHRGKKRRTKVSAIQRNHDKLFLKQGTPDVQVLNNSPSTEELGMPQLELTNRERSALMPLLPAPTPLLVPDQDRLGDPEAVLEVLQQDHDSLLQLRRQKKKLLKRKKPTNLLALRFPAITTGSVGKTATIMAQNPPPTTRTLLDKYSKQIKLLADEEQRLEDNVMARIAEEKTRLPLTFLFERNLMRRSDAQQDGLRLVTAIFAKLQHRMLYNSFVRWAAFLASAQHEERKREALHLAQKRAVALLERVSSDAYVGTLVQGFERWKTAVHNMFEHERSLAASVIQKAVRARRSRQQLEALRQAAEALDYRRSQAMQALLRFERYGTSMRWSTLRLGFDFAQQTRAARNLQLFLRRVAVRRRIAHRVQRREGALRLQTQWRAHLARQEVARRRAERALRVAVECSAATQLERAARGFLARKEASRRKQWLAKAAPTALRLQRWLRHRWGLAKLHAKFRDRKRAMEEARARAAAEELARRHWRSTIAVQCVLRGMLARKVYERRLKARRMEQAAVFLQRFWRRRRGLYALGLRFAERRERLAQCRWDAAVVMQSALRCYRARCRRAFLAEEKERRRRACSVIQRHVRGRVARKQYRHARCAALAIQCGVRCALARRRRARRQAAVHRLQSWVRGVYACRAARNVLIGLRVEAKRREASVVLIQKLVRQCEAQQAARTFREALNVVQIEQRRYFGSASGGIGWSTHEASSELLSYVTQRFLEDDACFTTKELRWLRAQVQAGHERLAREDRAAVYLQRRYRGFVTRMAYWVHRLQVEELRRLKEKKAVVIQSGARRWLAKRYVRRVREQRRLAELKAAYIRERQRKEDDRLWKERYDREQMELCVQRAQEAANQLREARREADLARVKAEAAEYRAKELAAEREIEALLEAPKDGAKSDGEEGEEEDKDPWMKLTDDYGNVYYYNDKTGESSWEPPPPRTKRPKTSPENEESREEGERPEEAKAKEIDPLDEVLRDGKCIKCQQVHSTKRCLDCQDTKRAFYCTTCFKQHSASSSGENLSAANSAKHDFEVVADAAATAARCESGITCAVDADDPPASSNNQEPAEKATAAYYCFECPRPPKLESSPEAANTSTEAELSAATDNGAATRGCFYCESCFARDHETATKLRHVENALRFRRGAPLCCDCGHALARRQCETCGGDQFCEACFTSSHTGSKRRTMTHIWTALDVLRDLLESETDRYCVECDVRASSRLCNLCGDGFCAGCFDKTHAKGAKRRHTWLPWSVAAQHGDWIEIKDATATTVYFNVETKESTTNKPNVLLSGEERHRLVLAEREQLQRSRQVELESEVVKLKEQLRELQAQERPGSRARTPGESVDTRQGPTSAKPPKRGVLSRLFGRKPPPRALTPEERQRIAEDLAIRVRADKQPVSSPVFQQAMVHELAALAVTSPQLTKPK